MDKNLQISTRYDVHNKLAWDIYQHIRIQISLMDKKTDFRAKAYFSLALLSIEVSYTSLITTKKNAIFIF